MDGGPAHGGGGGASSSLPPFLSKTYEMVDDPATDAVVAWTPAGTSFVVASQSEFSTDLLPKYFKHSNFSSFVRQLNTYGFRKVDPEQWEFSNDDFIRGQQHQLKNIRRRKPIFSHSSHNHGASSETERMEYEEEIERLKCGNASLLMEVQKNAQKKFDMDRRMQFLEDKLVAMEDRQRNLIGYLRQTVRSPAFLSNFIEQSDHHSKKRRLPKTHEDANVEDNQISHDHDMANSPVRSLNTESFDKMEMSLNSLENFLQDACQAFDDGMSYDDAAPAPPSAVVITELYSSGESDPHLRSPLSKMHASSAGLGDSHSSHDLADSTSCAESPSLPQIQPHVDPRAKLSQIDVNLEPAVTETVTSRDQPVENSSTVPTGINDGFWQQFLTEQPGYSDAHQEAESEWREGDNKTGQMKTADRANFWWDKKNMEHITEKLGHLTSGEKT